MSIMTNNGDHIVLAGTGRAKSMLMYTKGETIIDITRTYFNHVVWDMAYSDPIPDMPLDVQLEFTNRCNLVCESCPIRSNSRTHSMLEWDVLSEVADEAARESVCYFTICGIGEPTLSSNVFRFLRYVRNLKVDPKGLRTLSVIPTVMISNGMWTAKQLDALIADPPDLLSVSLAGFTDADILARRGGINIERFRHNVGELFRRRHLKRPVDGGISPVIHVSTHVFPREMQNDVAMKTFIETWLDISDVVVVKPTMITQRYNNPAMFAGDTYLAYSNISENHFERTAPCFETSRRLSVNSDGNVWCGHHNSEDFGDFLGNVKQQSLREIWHGKEMNVFRQQVRAAVFCRRACRSCGGEIRDVHRKGSREMESEIHFGSS